MTPDKPEELTEQELEKVAGGHPQSQPTPPPPAPKWTDPEGQPSWVDPDGQPRQG